MGPSNKFGGCPRHRCPSDNSARVAAKLIPPAAPGTNRREVTAPPSIGQGGPCRNWSPWKPAVRRTIRRVTASPLSSDNSARAATRPTRTRCPSDNSAGTRARIAAHRTIRRVPRPMHCTRCPSDNSAGKLRHRCPSDKAARAATQLVLPAGSCEGGDRVDFVQAVREQRHAPAPPALSQRRTRRLLKPGVSSRPPHGGHMLPSGGHSVSTYAFSTTSRRRPDSRCVLVDL